MLTPVTNYDFNLPEDLIAQYPSEKRENSRLLVVDRQNGSFKEYLFSEITNFIKDDYFLVLNNTKVIKSRLFPKKITGGKIELFLVEQLEKDIFKAMTKGKINIGETVYFENGEECRILSKAEDNLKIVELKNHKEIMEKYGHIPLPPYIKRPDTHLDHERYQTVYASKDGSVAAPTAGLHFTKEIISDIKKNSPIFEITLNVGLGTFKPIKTEYVEEHVMHSENFYIEEDVKNSINNLKKDNKKLLAVGSTTVRALESASDKNRLVSCGNLTTSIFIKKGYTFKIVDAMLTNFHLPKSTLFIMICAFGGEDLIKEAYSYAIKNRFRFFSYGDAMLVL